MGTHQRLKALLLLVSILFLLLFVSVFVRQQAYLAWSFLFMAVASLPFIIGFSKNNLSTRELVVVALLSAVSAVSRVPFAAIPSLQPSTFVIITSGISLGPEVGFVVGMMTAIISNFFLGQGPWTPWQMFAWGMIGLLAGLLRQTPLMKNKIFRSAYGLVSGVLFGWLMNLWVILGLGEPLNWTSILAYYTSSLTFDLIHGLGNVAFIWLFSDRWLKILNRFIRKYGLFRDRKQAS